MFAAELLKPGNAMLLAFALILGTVFLILNIWWLGGMMGGLAGIVAAAAYKASIPNRFRNKRFLYLWTNIEDRMKRLAEGMTALRKADIADLQELPGTVHTVRSQLYLALRRADMALNEISRSEGFLLGGQAPPNAPRSANDPQAARLWQEAHKASLEYRRLLAGILGSVERTEAQAALFSATLDTLRVKMLGYRLAGRPSDQPSLEFLQALTEARMQLDSIDKALDELEMTPFPTTIAYTPESAEDFPDLASLKQTLETLDMESALPKESAPLADASEPAALESKPVDEKSLEDKA